jgi:hypothetical protein
MIPPWLLVGLVGDEDGNQAATKSHRKVMRPVPEIDARVTVTPALAVQRRSPIINGKESLTVAWISLVEVSGAHRNE